MTNFIHSEAQRYWRDSKIEACPILWRMHAHFGLPGTEGG